MSEHLKLNGTHMPHVDHGGYFTNEYFLQLDPGTSYQDLFNPTFWKHHASRLQINDIIRVLDQSRTFDVKLTVTDKGAEGLTMRLWPIYPTDEQLVLAREAAEEADEIRLTEVPLMGNGEPIVRVEYLAACKWRVRGLDGEEVSRDHPTKEEAEKSMFNYIRGARLEMPSEAKITAARAEHAEHQAAKKARNRAA